MTNVRHVALVADDDQFFRMVIGSILLDRLDVAEVIEVGSFDEALERMGERADITIATFDLSMPGMKGPATIAAIREAFPDTITAVVSSSRNRQDILTALQVGAKGYVPKWMGINDLTHGLRTILEGTVYVPPHLVEASSEGSE